MFKPVTLTSVIEPGMIVVQKKKSLDQSLTSVQDPADMVKSIVVQILKKKSNTVEKVLVCDLDL